MDEFEQVLEDGLQEIASGAASREQVLARHPEYAGRLKPLLISAARLEGGRDILPSADFKARTRTRLTTYALAHPHSDKPSFPRIGQIVALLAVLALAFLVTGTAFAQNALPGEALYPWKLSSEVAWRWVAPDPVYVDLGLADRRAYELTSVAADPGREAKALSGYQEVLTRLRSETDKQNSGRIIDALKVHKQKLSAAGITIPELNTYLDLGGTSQDSSGNTVLPNLETQVPPAPAPKTMPTNLPVPGATPVPGIKP